MEAFKLETVTIHLKFWVYLGVKTCEFFLCLGVIVCVLYIVSELFVVLLVLCFTGFYTEDEPGIHSVQLTAKAATLGKVIVF